VNCVLFVVIVIVNTQITDFWEVTSSSLVDGYRRRIEDGGSSFLRNDGAYVSDCKVSLTSHKT
jgi:hypothetical protein